MTERTLSELADAHWKLEVRIRRASAIVKKLEDEQEKIGLEAVERSREEKNMVCRGRLASGEVRPRELYSIKDFQALWTWMKRTNTPHILQRRIGAETFRELQDNRVKVPGIKVITQYVFRTKGLKSK